MTGARTTLAIPCRRDEPALARLLDLALASWRAWPQARHAGLEVLVALNGAGGDGPRQAAAACARREDAVFTEVDVDVAAAGPPPAAAALAVRVLHTRRAGKPLAWNALRLHAASPVAVFVDADVTFAPDALPRLLDALDAHPAAALAAGKTACAARPGLFEAVMAAPYGVDFPNLSPQLYAARLARLPAAMPEDLIEPERWLELVLGRDAVVRVPEARVVVRLPGSWRDFWRQRVRIEMGKVQLREDHAALLARSAPQPGVRAVLRSLDAATVLRLGAYLGLRSLAHGVAWWRWRRGHTAGIWRQAASTKEWDAA
jgi:hypothetical protein